MTGGSNQILTVEQLADATGYERWGDISRSLQQHGIHYFIGKGGRPWTTVDLVNAAGGLNPSQQNTEYYSPDIV